MACGRYSSGKLALFGLIVATSPNRACTDIDIAPADSSGALSVYRNKETEWAAAAHDDTAWYYAKDSMDHLASAIRESKRIHDDDASNNLIKYKRRKALRKRQRELVVGGAIADPGRYPYVVSLQLEKILDEPVGNDGADVSDVHTCGGTLIAMDVVLTAGHCGYEELQPPVITNAQGSVDVDGNVNFGEMPTVSGSH